MAKKYINSFSNEEEYNNYKSSSDFVTPNVSFISENMVMHYDKSINIKSGLHFSSESPQAVKIYSIDSSVGEIAPVTANIEYSTDGKTWSPISKTEQPSSINFKDNKGTYELYLRGNNPDGFSNYNESTEIGVYNVIHLVNEDSKTSCSGSIMSLISYNSDVTSIPCSGCFVNLFNSESKALVDVSNLYLTAKILTNGCYSRMFSSCTGLKWPPKSLPANNLKSYCYNEMFSGCTSLITTPKIEATELEHSCCKDMFKNCKSITSAPELNALHAKSSCYSGMFSGCTSLRNAPNLPATTVENFCYMHMFEDCTSLKSTPDLPSRIIWVSSYNEMFKGCTGLTTVMSSLPALALGEFCYAGMFEGCTSITVAPSLPAPALMENCYSRMFEGCSNLKKIEALFLSEPNDWVTFDWVSGVSSSGTFIKNANATWSVYGDNGIPEGWTVQTK